MVGTAVWYCNVYLLTYLLSYEFVNNRVPPYSLLMATFTR